MSKTPKLFHQSRGSLLGRQAGDKLSGELDGLLYSDRGIALGTGERDNVVIIHPSDAGSHIDWMMEHFRYAGLGPLPNIVVGELQDFKGSELETHDFRPFIFYPDEHDFQPNHKWFSVVDEQDQKNKFIEVCRAMKIPTPKTILVSNKNHLGDLEKLKYPLWFKISRSFTGRGVFKANSANELAALLTLISPEIAFQLQEDLGDKLVTCLNLQYTAVSGKAIPSLLTDQELKGTVHVGNKYLGGQHHRAAWNSTFGLANELAKRGLRHTFAFDVAVMKTSGGYRYLLLENNPRVNGSTTPTAIVQKLGYAGDWVAKPFKLKKKLTEIDLGEILYNRKLGYGVVPHITSTASKKNEISATIMAPTESMRLDLEEKLNLLLM